MNDLNSKDDNESFNELNCKIHSLPCCELKHYLLLISDSLHKTGNKFNRDILQECSLFCDKIDAYYQCEDNAKENAAIDLAQSLNTLIEQSALYTISHRIKNGLVTMLGLLLGLVFSVVFSIIGVVTAVFQSNILSSIIKGFSTGLYFGLIIGLHMPKNWLISKEERKLKQAIQGLSDGLENLKTPSHNFFMDEVENQTSQIKKLFDEQHPHLSGSEKQKHFHTFLTTNCNSYQIISSPAQLLCGRHSELLGFHTYSKFILFEGKHSFTISSPNTEFENIPASMKQEKKITGQQLIEMMVFNKLNSRDYISNNLSQLSKKFCDDDPNYFKHLYSLLSLTSQLDTEHGSNTTTEPNTQQIMSKGFAYLNAYVQQSSLLTSQSEHSFHISTSSYAPNQLSPLHARKPLIISSSGGGGHISAANGIVNFLEKHYPNIAITKHSPEPRNDKDPSTYGHLQLAMTWLHEKNISKPLQHILKKYTYIPILPNKKELETEIKLLKQKNAPYMQRNYIDMLLDVAEIGYESVGIYNALIKNDDASSLQKLPLFQQQTEKFNYARIYKHFLTLLMDAAKANKPYTELISTQILGFKPLCDAVSDYHQWLDNHELYNDYPKPIIHQYMTDLPSNGASHYYDGLRALTEKQRSFMKLYGCELDIDFLINNIPLSHSFAGLHKIDRKDNPMVRAGFNNPATSLHNKWHIDNEITYTDYEINPSPDSSTYTLKPKKDKAKLTIKADEKIASIMLGSQASIDTICYASILASSDCSKVFVFGGLNQNIYPIIQQMMAENPKLKDKIICLGNQEDDVIQPIMTRSQKLIIRGGGLSIMEQMQMDHHPEQEIYIHHSDNETNTLTSGIEWEDGNVDKFIKDAQKNKLSVQKTSPSKFSQLIKNEHAANSQLSDEKVYFQNTKNQLFFTPQVNTRSTPNMSSIKVNCI